MPCYIVASIALRDINLARKAASEIGLVEGKDYTVSGGRIYPIGTLDEGKLKQRYGVLEAERQARKKGIKTSRKTTQDGTIQLRLG